MKILFYGESPCIETGAGRVNRHILDALIESNIEVEVLATSHFYEDSYDRERYPYSITHIKADRPDAPQIDTHRAALRAIEERRGTFDVLFISADNHVPNIMIDAVRRYPSLVHSAIDGEVKHPNQVAGLEVCRWGVVFSKFAYAQVLQHIPNAWDKLDVIYHGCEPDTFFPLGTEERREYRKKAFNIEDDETFLVMVCNRNQIRKDLARSMRAFHLFHERVPNSKLYMHCRKVDHGGNLPSQAFFSGLKTTGPQAEVIFAGDDYTEVAGYSRDVLNKMYNAADVGISTAQGEGWGLTTTEFMAAGTPFIGPANTTFFEILGNGERGYLAKCGGEDLWSIYYGMDDAPRPITSVSDMAKKLSHVYHHRSEAFEKSIVAREWTETHTWEHVKDEWKDLFRRVQASCDEWERAPEL